MREKIGGGPKVVCVKVKWWSSLPIMIWGKHKGVNEK